ncbi:hypothetical protein Slin14017_G128880 [Septoria linicola]|nr:hypothetical protein Slin14017_G128880 [Septoria linicola]
MNDEDPPTPEQLPIVMAALAPRALQPDVHTLGRWRHLTTPDLEHYYNLLEADYNKRKGMVLLALEHHAHVQVLTPGARQFAGLLEQLCQCVMSTLWSEKTETLNELVRRWDAEAQREGDAERVGPTIGC